jgi:hypothetical protein
MMSFEKRKIKLSINNLDYSFYYSCNASTTFQDLLEYFSFLVPYLNVCQCYRFYLKADNKKNKDFVYSLDSKVIDFSDNLDKLVIQKDNDKCEHDYQNFWLFSKQKIISYFQKYIDNLNKEIYKLKNECGTFSTPHSQKDFYDVVVQIDSIKSIKKGWKICMTERGKKNYEKYKNEKIVKIGVVGNANKGKSFLLSKISKMSLPSGMSVKTEGLSIKYPELKDNLNRRIVLLDSAGLETPVLDSGKNNLEGKDKNEIFKEKCRDKLITELFLQNYIIHNSDILIAVVDILSFSEQKLLLKFKKEIENAKRNQPVIVIHNLKTYTTIEQVDDYIENTLLKSATFKLEKGPIVGTNNTNFKIKYILYEKANEKTPAIFHLIYANENSKAGSHYNGFTLNFIENSYQSITNHTSYDVIETTKERFIQVSKEILEKKEKENDITKDSFDERYPNYIKLKRDKEITLKKCFIDEIGFSNLIKNGFEPKYNVFKKDNKIIIRVEAPGNCPMVAEKIVQGELFIIRLSGEKKKDIVPEKLEDNIYNKREIGKFILDIPLSSKEYIFSEKPPTFDYHSCVQFIEYELKGKEGPYGPEGRPLI